MTRLLSRWWCLFVVLLVAGCATGAPRGVTKAGGAAQARKDLAAGKVKVLVGGGFAVYAPGVPEKEPRFTKLPRERVPNGCTTPHAAEWFDFAEGYNAVVVEFIRGGSARRR